ncbi:MAG: pyridoxal phosphate-dependent aminotransferase [Proteobacteria bacterium]|nr:pyridoxal phosphate-dependent aminotransferase [Pseudomonadota bacterium]
MDRFSARLSRIKPSATMSITQRASEMRARGIDVISFSAGEPDFDTPPHIIESAKKALDDGMTRYTSVAGIPDLRRAVAEETSEVRGVPCKPEQIIVTVGAKHTLYEFFQAVIDPGDEVIIPAPYWVSYPDQVLLSDGVPVIVKTRAENGFVLTPEAFTKALTLKTKVLVLNTPNNPTGAVYSAKAVEKLTEAAVEAGLFVISDEVYRELIYGDATHTSPLSVVAEDKRDKIFVVDGVSKTYAMTGWRIGWGIGHPDIIEAMSKVQGQSTSNPTAVAQAAALKAITGSKDFLPSWREEYKTRRDTIVEGLNRMQGVTCLKPGGAFYVLPSFKGVIERMGDDATDLALTEYLLEEARVAGVPGSPFGAPGHIRFSYAMSLKAIEEGLHRIEQALLRIKSVKRVKKDTPRKKRKLKTNIPRIGCPFCMEWLPSPVPLTNVFSATGSNGGRCSCGAFFVLDETGRSGGQALMDVQTLACDGDLDRALKLESGTDFDLKTRAYQKTSDPFGGGVRGHPHMQTKAWVLKLKEPE